MAAYDDDDDEMKTMMMTTPRGRYVEGGQIESSFVNCLRLRLTKLPPPYTFVQRHIFLEFIIIRVFLIRAIPADSGLSIVRPSIIMPVPVKISIRPTVTECE